MTYKGKHIGTYAADLVIEDRLPVEVKCVEHFSNEHLAQCINYQKGSGLHLRIADQSPPAKVEWRRIVHDL